VEAIHSRGVLNLSECESNAGDAELAKVWDLQGDAAVLGGDVKSRFVLRRRIDEDRCGAGGLYLA
jgi:hypothetical protein